MLVANSFDLWRKDTFFSAAEEVQESADIMESAYRAWLRERRERSNTVDLNELCRELQTALGTAKWQLEEFEKAVRLSYRHLGDDHRATRHRQFISAIESQISQVEVTLREFYIEEGKQPLRWVNLDEEERDDFAAFLSGTCETIQSTKDECMDVSSPSTKISLAQKQVNKEDKIVNANVNVNAFCSWDSSTNEKASMDVVAFNKGRDCAIEIKADGISRNSDDVVSQTDVTTSTRKTWSPPPNYAALRIVIADEDEQRNKLTRTVDATPKDKGIKPLFWKQKFEEYPQAMRAVHMFNQLFGRIGLCQRKLQSPLRLRRGHSLKVTLALMIIIFLLDIWQVRHPLVRFPLTHNVQFTQWRRDVLLDHANNLTTLCHQYYLSLCILFNMRLNCFFTQSVQEVLMVMDKKATRCLRYFSVQEKWTSEGQPTNECHLIQLGGYY